MEQHLERAEQIGSPGETDPLPDDYNDAEEIEDEEYDEQASHKLKAKYSRKQLKKMRREAAEEVCFTLLLLMHVGGLELPQSERDMIGEPMQTWADLAAAMGDIGEGSRS